MKELQEKDKIRGGEHYYDKFEGQTREMVNDQDSKENPGRERRHSVQGAPEGGSKRYGDKNPRPSSAETRQIKVNSSPSMGSGNAAASQLSTRGGANSRNSNFQPPDRDGKTRNIVSLTSDNLQHLNNANSDQKQGNYAGNLDGKQKKNNDNPQNAQNNSRSGTPNKYDRKMSSPSKKKGGGRSSGLNLGNLNPGFVGTNKNKDGNVVIGQTNNSSSMTTNVTNSNSNTNNSQAQRKINSITSNPENYSLAKNIPIDDVIRDVGVIADANDDGFTPELNDLVKRHDQLISLILQEEEELIGAHRAHIDSMVELIKEEMVHLNHVDRPGSDVGNKLSRDQLMEKMIFQKYYKLQKS